MKLQKRGQQTFGIDRPISHDTHRGRPFLARDVQVPDLYLQRFRQRLSGGFNSLPSTRFKGGPNDPQRLWPKIDRWKTFQNRPKIRIY